MDVPLYNFKGVMLCNRPNANVMVHKEKPFCSRVQPQEQWGLTKKPEESQTIKPVVGNPVLERHKKWLDEFKLQHQMRRLAKEEQVAREEDKFQRVRDMAKKDREVTKKMKEEYRAMNELIKKELREGEAEQPTVKLTAENLKKLEEKQEKQEPKEKAEKVERQETHPKEVRFQDGKPNGNKRYKTKPVWAMTKEEEEQHLLEEEDNLLKFVENLDCEQYMNDLEVNVMMKALKQRVDELKKDEDWREKAEKSEREKAEKAEKEKVKRDEDIYDRVSESLQRNEDGKSVQSDKTLNSISQLRKKQEEQLQGKADWEKSTQSEKRAPIEDRIAKYVADEILRQYKNLSNIHSNSSIRKILEREAKKTLCETGIPGPVISTIKNERKSGVDPNCLPYLHRNPAI